MVVSFSVPVWVLISLTLAPGMLARVESWTTPATVAVLTWAPLRIPEQEAQKQYQGADESKPIQHRGAAIHRGPSRGCCTTAGGVREELNSKANELISLACCIGMTLRIASNESAIESS